MGGTSSRCRSCGSLLPPPYSAHVSEEAEGAVRSPLLPLYSEDTMVGDEIQGGERRQDKKARLFTTPPNDHQSHLGSNDVGEGNCGHAPAVRSTSREGAFSGQQFKIGWGERPVRELERTKRELEALRHSSAIERRNLEAKHEMETVVAAAAADLALLNARHEFADQLAAAKYAAADAAHRIEVLELKLTYSEISCLERLAASERDATKSIKLARLEERIDVAGLRLELRRLGIPAPRRNVSAPPR